MYILSCFIYKMFTHLQYNYNFKYKYNTKQLGYMKVSNLIIEKILNDNQFSSELAIELGIQQQSVLGLARRNSSKLTLYQAVMFFKKKGFSDKEIFEEPSQNNNK